MILPENFNVQSAGRVRMHGGTPRRTAGIGDYNFSRAVDDSS